MRARLARKTFMNVAPGGQPTGGRSRHGVEHPDQIRLPGHPLESTSTNSALRSDLGTATMSNGAVIT